MTAQNYEKPGLSQARAFCILRTSPLPIGKWGTSNLILVQQKDAPRVKIKRDTCGKCGRHPFSKEEQRGRMDFHKLCPSLCSGVKISSHTSEEWVYLFFLNI